MKNYKRYGELKKPSFSPPARVFAPVWTALYIIIALSFGGVAYRAFDLLIPAGLLLPFLLNLIFNFLYVPLEFKFKSNFLAALDILLVLATLVYALVRIYRFVPWVAYVNIPYVLWVAYATVLQLSIVWLNRTRK